ncbi:MAG: hypothetical protein ACFN3I_13090, partial [Arachnia propionica]
DLHHVAKPAGDLSARQAGGGSQAALAEEAERLRVADHDDLFDQPDTRDRITPASVNRVLEGAAPLRPGQLAFILRAAHMDVGRVQGSGDA